MFHAATIENQDSVTKFTRYLFHYRGLFVVYLFDIDLIGSVYKIEFSCQRRFSKYFMLIPVNHKDCIACPGTGSLRSYQYLTEGPRNRALGHLAVNVEYIIYHRDTFHLPVKE